MCYYNTKLHSVAIVGRTWDICIAAYQMWRNDVGQGEEEKNRILLNMTWKQNRICPCTIHTLALVLMNLAHTRTRTYSTAKLRPLPWGFSQDLPAEIRCRRALPAPLASRLAARSKIRLILTTRHDPSSISRRFQCDLLRHQLLKTANLQRNLQLKYAYRKLPKGKNSLQRF